MSASSRHCYKCGSSATTKDHVVPRGLFPKSSTARRITVPACIQCNRDISADEEYFRTVLLSMHWNPSQAVQEVIDQKLRPSLEPDNTKLRRDLLATVEDVFVNTDRGLVRTGLMKIDAARMDRVMEKIVRGLYFKLKGEQMPIGVDFSHHWMPKVPLFDEALQGGVINIDPNVFTCRFRLSAGAPHASMWWLLFYKSALHVVAAIEPNTGHVE